MPTKSRRCSVLGKARATTFGHELFPILTFGQTILPFYLKLPTEIPNPLYSKGYGALIVWIDLWFEDAKKYNVISLSETREFFSLRGIKGVKK